MLEYVHLPIKTKAKRPVLGRLPRHEPQLLASLRWRDPIEPYEREVWSRFLGAVSLRDARPESLEVIVVRHLFLFDNGTEF